MRNLTQAIAQSIVNYGDPNSFISKMRRRRIEPLLRMIEKVFAEKGEVTILDVGGTKEYWNIVPIEYIERNHVHITLINIPGENGQEECIEKHFDAVTGDGCDMRQYADYCFDIVHSNSVIEHVGDWNRMKAFADEVKRLARRHFIQTPNFWFPIEPHFVTPFFHWMPEAIRVRMIMLSSLGHYRKARDVDEAVQAVQSARLINSSMLQALFPDSKILKERFLMLPKSIVAIRE